MTIDRDGTGGEPPARPRTMAELGFERRPMVRWLSPSILADAALRVVISSVFGQYADKREFQAALDPNPGAPTTYAAEDEADGALWLDFAADLGDGFDATYAVASLLARPSIEAGGHVLPRGRALLLGGDQVYPDPTRDAYRHRFHGPYEAALPWVPEGGGPDLFAIPGNHDWYDGLTEFLRLFCGGRRIGGWQTHQRRSYFALQLPHRWWLLGIDIQLDTRIDRPQLDYFRGVGLQPGDNVVLVTGKPSWVKVRDGNVPDSYENLCFFEEEIVLAAGAEVRASISGDLHHYARYAAADGGQLVTAGGGGAYLSPTHLLPDRVDLPRARRRRDDEADRGGRPRIPHERRAAYPEPDESRAMARRAWALPRHAPSLCALVAGMHALLGASVFAAIAAGPGWAVAAVLLAAVLSGLLIAYCAAPTRALRLVLGGAHAAAHVAVAAAPAVIATEALGAKGALAGLLVTAVTAVTGFAVGGVLFGVYLVLTHTKVPNHANEVLAAQAIPDRKCFLRLRFDAEGLTIFPIGLHEVPRGWEPAPEDPRGSPLLRPRGAALAPHLIEAPVRVPRGGRPSPAEPAARTAVEV